MKKFIAHIKQDGGCDYTIGCGVNLLTIDASNIEEAKEKMKETIKEEYSWSETYLSSCDIYEVSSHTVLDVKSIYNDIKKEKDEIKLRLKEEKERSEYNRLIKKFGDYK
jgi:hypothetical protein